MKSRAQASAFDAVPEPLRRALEARGFESLTAVQSAVLDAKAEGRDLQVSSQTGSGKTVAIGLVLAPVLMAAAASKEKPRVRTLVIAPTRELAVQVAGELQWLYAEVPGVKVESVTGGSSVLQEKRRLSARPTVVVGTPGRLLDHIRSGALDCSQIEGLVLDEADRMLDMGFREELEAILDTTPATRSTHLVSATFAAGIRSIAKKYQKDPLAVQGTVPGAANEDIEHVGHLLRPHDRYDAMVNLLLLAGSERVLIFVNTRAQASELADQLIADGFAAAPISGELEQNQRTRTLEAFRSGLTNVLVATDVAARGLDIPEVELVIHTDAPMDVEGYTHRAGRTGRAGRKGRSVLLASPSRRRRVETILSQAGVKLQWRDVPSAASVEKALAKRERRRLHDAIAEGPEPSAEELASALSMLEEMDEAGVVDLVARLVALVRDRRTAAPRDVETLPVNQAPLRAHRGRVQGHDEGWSAPAAKPRARTARSEGAVLFEINWGHRGGATPQRLLAMLCRRGDVTSRAIGTMEIGLGSSTFEVAGPVAGDFERRVSEPDERDPHLHVRRSRRRHARADRD